MDQLRGSNIVKMGIDLTEFYVSVEWDILAVPATRNEEYYTPQRYQEELNPELDEDGNALESDAEDDLMEGESKSKLLTGKWGL